MDIVQYNVLMSKLRSLSHIEIISLFPVLQLISNVVENFGATSEKVMKGVRYVSLEARCE